MIFVLHFVLQKNSWKSQNHIWGIVDEKKRKDDKILSFRIEKALKKNLVLYSRKNHISISETIRLAIERLVVSNAENNLFIEDVQIQIVKQIIKEVMAENTEWLIKLIVKAGITSYASYL